MTIYQEEMRRQAQKMGCNWLLVVPYLQILRDDKVIAEVGENGNFRYPAPQDEETQKLIDSLSAEARLVREYVDIFEKAPAMTAVDVSQYRNFSEYGSVVLAGAYNPLYGFLFSTWEKSYDGTYVAHGHYTHDYRSAKEDFAVRSGLVKACKLFNCDQSIDLYDSIAFARCHDDQLTYEMDMKLNALQKQLADAYPQLEARQVMDAPDIGMTQTM